MMRSAACLQRYRARRTPSKELEQFAPRQLATEHHGAALIRAVRMKNTLGDIQTDCGNF
jgi:hypothetical protein